MPLKVLFVDDQPQTIAIFREALQDRFANAQIQTKRSLRTALEVLSAKDADFDVLLIDLNIPPIPPGELEIYNRKLNRLDLNHGQTLGMWLNKEHPETAHAYLSALPGELDRTAESSQVNVPLFTKDYSIDDFAQTVYNIWQKHRERVAQQSPHSSPAHGGD